MSHVRETDIDPFGDMYLFCVVAGHKECQHPLGIRHGVKRRFGGLSCTHRLAVLPLGFLFLDMRAVLQHNLAQITSRTRRKDLSAEALCINQGQHTAVVNVRVREKYIMNLIVSHGQRHVLIDIHALFHTAVHKDILSTGFNDMHASGYFMVGADKR